MRSPSQLVLFVSALTALSVGASGVLASPPPKIVSLGPDLIAILTKPPVQDRKTGVLEGVELQGEAVSETAAAANGWRSMRAVLDVSCPQRLDRVRSMTVFEEHNGRGAARALTPPADWIMPDQNTSYGLAVVKYFCGGGAGAERATRVPTPKPPPVASLPEEATAMAPPNPSQAADPRVAASALEPSGATANVMSTVDKTALSPEQKALRPPKPNARLTRTAALGLFAVQVGSTIVQADANAILDRLKTTHADLFGGLQTRIEMADVRGQRHYRAIVTGFPDTTGAASFCTAIRASIDCIVRRAP